MKLSIIIAAILAVSVHAVNKKSLKKNEQAMFFDGEDCKGAHSGAVSMNNDGCLRSEAGRRAVILGPDTYAKNPFDAWCLEKFDDDNCECQSAGHFLATDPGTCYILPEGPKSYRFRVGGCTDNDSWGCL